MTAFQCLLFAVLLLTASGKNRLPKLFLALFLLQHVAIPIDILISFGVEFRESALSFSPNLFYIFVFGYWLEAPLMLWYVRSLIYKRYVLQWSDLVYLLPFLAFLVHQCVFYFSLGESEKTIQLESYNNLTHIPSYQHWITFARELFRVALGVLCLVELSRYRSHVHSKFSHIHKHELTWLTLLITGFTLLRAWSVLVLVFVILNAVFKVSVNFELMGLIGNYTTFLLVSMLIFFSLGHSIAYEGLDRNELNDEPPCGDENNEDHGRALTAYMQTQKPYLNSTLSLDLLAKEVEISPRLLSRVINRQFECNFFEYINSYRVEEAVGLLGIQDSEKTILDIGFDSGFNSKTTFNSFFKKKLGFTPSEYRKSKLV
jgi:AraC-like DNA-binding protein